jgi:Flp pilus assembly protein CpaB
VFSIGFRALDIGGCSEDRLLFVNVTPLVETRGAGTTPAARRLGFSRPSLSHVLIALAVVLAFTFNFLALQDRAETVLVAVANGPVEAGSRLTPADVRFVPVDASFEGLSTLVDEGRWESVSGWVAIRAIPDGGVISVETLTRPRAGEGLRSMSIPVSKEHAAGGLLEVGDVVDVISVGASGPEFVVAGVEVVSIAGDSGGIGGVSGYFVVLAVDATEAIRLAGAIDAGSVEVIRASGAAPVSIGAGP